MPKNLGLYNENLSVPRKQDIDVVASRVSTNEDNIAMLDSDMAAAQGDITTLKGNVTTLTNALGSKQDKIVGGASTITDDNLTANRALVSNASGKVAASAVTATELGYLDGVTSAVQTQLNGKYSANNPPPYPVTSVAGKTGDVTLTKSNVGLGNVDNVKQYSASNPPPYPVTSVNGKTGAVTVSVPTVPSTTSLIKGNGSGGLVAATRGSDYIASGNIVKQTLVATETTPTEDYAINWVYE